MQRHATEVFEQLVGDYDNFSGRRGSPVVTMSHAEGHKEAAAGSGVGHRSVRRRSHAEAVDRADPLLGGWQGAGICGPRKRSGQHSGGSRWTARRQMGDGIQVGTHHHFQWSPMASGWRCRAGIRIRMWC